MDATELTYEPLAEDGVTVLAPIEQALALASTPAQSQEVEALAKAATAWASERGDYDKTVKAAQVYILARRKTTELILPHVRKGKPAPGSRLLADFNVTPGQWRRRKVELAVEMATVFRYVDECIATGAVPTATGLVAFDAGPSGAPDPDFDTIRRRLLTGAGRWLEAAQTDEQRARAKQIIRLLDKPK